MMFPAKAVLMPCPLEGCSGWAETRTDMWVHFCHWNVWATVVILEYGNPTHPRCPQCDMLLPWGSLNGIHWCNAQCKKGEERN